MRKSLRFVVGAAIAAGVWAVPGAGSADASCYPQKPSTCEPDCPGTTTRVGPVTACVPIDVREIVELECTCPPQ